MGPFSMAELPKVGFHGHGGIPVAGWPIMENPNQMDDNWGYPYDSGNQNMYIRNAHDICPRLSHWR